MYIKYSQGHRSLLQLAFAPFYDTGGETLEQVAQSITGGPIPGNIPGQAGGGSEHPGLVEDVPARCRGLGWMASEGPSQPKAFCDSFCDSMNTIAKDSLPHSREGNATLSKTALGVPHCKLDTVTSSIQQAHTTGVCTVSITARSHPSSLYCRTLAEKSRF